MAKPNFILVDTNRGENFFPLNLLRPVFDIKFGVLSIREKLLQLTGTKELSVVCDEKYSGNLKHEKNLNVNSPNGKNNLIINSNHIPEKFIIRFIEKNPGKVVTKEGKFLGCFYTGVIKEVQQVKELLSDSKGIEYSREVKFIEYSWDTIRYRNETIVSDIELLKKNFKSSPKAVSKATLINPKNIFVDKSVSVLPGSIIDATDGAVMIEKDSVIEPFSYIKGPAYIGEKVTVKSGTKIYGPVSIGYYSKVSGEISGCIFHSFVNKQHDGFTGDSYFCPFVNLGADTVTSNLKNNYSEVRVKNHSGEHKTGMQFLGSLIGDHSKTSINTMLNTGSLIGIFANMFGGGFHEKFVESFTWNESGKESVVYDFDKAIHSSETAMGRRGERMPDEYKKLCKSVFGVASKKNL